MTNEIERTVRAHTKRSPFTRVFHAKYDKEKIQTWRQDIHKILGVFNVCRGYDFLFSR